MIRGGSRGADNTIGDVIFGWRFTWYWCYPWFKSTVQNYRTIHRHCALARNCIIRSDRVITDRVILTLVLQYSIYLFESFDRLSRTRRLAPDFQTYLTYFSRKYRWLRVIGFLSDNRGDDVFEYSLSDRFDFVTGIRYLRSDDIHIFGIIVACHSASCCTSDV